MRKRIPGSGSTRFQPSWGNSDLPLEPCQPGADDAEPGVVGALLAGRAQQLHANTHGQGWPAFTQPLGQCGAHAMPIDRGHCSAERSYTGHHHPLGAGDLIAVRRFRGSSTGSLQTSYDRSEVGGAGGNDCNLEAHPNLPFVLRIPSLSMWTAAARARATALNAASAMWWLLTPRI